MIRKNRFFVVHVTNADGDPLPVREIEAQLQLVIDSAGPNPVHPVGVLTAQGRTEWARAREQLVADGNEELLERAEAAVLAVCLDDTAPHTRADVGRALWHGDGRNRHFDKAVQLVVFENGKAGMTGEHSMMDGMPVRLGSDMCALAMRDGGCAWVGGKKGGPSLNSVKGGSGEGGGGQLVFRIP